MSLVSLPKTEAQNEKISRFSIFFEVLLQFLLHMLPSVVLSVLISVSRDHYSTELMKLVLVFSLSSWKKSASSKYFPNCERIRTAFLNLDTFKWHFSLDRGIFTHASCLNKATWQRFAEKLSESHCISGKNFHLCHN